MTHDERTDSGAGIGAAIGVDSQPAAPAIPHSQLPPTQSLADLTGTRPPSTFGSDGAMAGSGVPPTGSTGSTGASATGAGAGTFAGTTAGATDPRRQPPLLTGQLSQQAPPQLLPGEEWAQQWPQQNSQFSGRLPGQWPVQQVPAWGTASASGWSRPIGAGPAPGVSWASVGSRFSALILDALVMFGTLVVVAIVAAALGVTETPVGSAGATRVEYSTSGAAVLWLWFLFFLLYHPASWFLMQATPGQRAVGLRVVRERDGQRLGLGAVFLRYVVWFACMLTFVLAIVEAIAAASEASKRAWHDEAAGSVVIRTS